MFGGAAVCVALFTCAASGPQKKKKNGIQSTVNRLITALHAYIRLYVIIITT